MPTLPGEVLLLNVFADVRYCFSQPSVKPVHDRFDKASYVYLYYNSTQRRARLEVANAAGTSDQDAFNGYLDTVTLANSYKHPTLFSIVVDGVKSTGSSPHPVDQSQWHLPAFDPRSQQKYLYKIHSLDIYLWTAKDATSLLDSISRVLSFRQLQITEQAPPPEHDASMSPVVQQLERIAVSTPSHARAPSAASNQSHPGALNRTPDSYKSGPYPVSATPASAVMAPAVPAPAVPTPSFTPYNPAAPSAPEPIAHREKTPPPIDAANGTGLSAAPTYDQPTQFGNPNPAFSQQAMFPGPPQRTTSLQSLPPPPPPQTQHPHQVMQTPTSLAPPPPSTQPQTQYASYPAHQSAHYPQSPGFPISTPLQSPGMPLTPGQPPAYSQYTPLQSPTFMHTPLQSPGIPPPPSNFSNYTYAPQVQQQQGSQNDVYGVHGQAYRPTEAEAAHGAHAPKPQSQQQQAGTKPGGLEQRMGRVEKGVGRFLRKLDQKI